MANARPDGSAEAERDVPSGGLPDTGRRLSDRLVSRRAPELAGESLRADWLKLRGYLFDPLTRLPALPAVLDEVRRRLEDGDELSLLYLDLSGGGHAESASGWQAHDQMLRHAANALFDVCRDLGGHRVRRSQVAQVGVRSDEFVVFLEPAADSNGLAKVHDELLGAVCGALLADAREGDLPQVESAVVDLPVDPTLRIERAIYRAVDRARDLCRAERLRRQSRRLRELHRMLADEDVVVRFQPIVDMDEGTVHGLEALSGAPDAKTFENPEMLFTFAEESESIVDLERLCRRLALGRANGLVPNGGKLFLNCSAHSFSDAGLVESLLAMTRAAGRSPDSLVLEVTERVAITEWQTFRASLDRVREEGFLVAIDDMGSGYSSLHAVAEIQPDYLKFDLSLIRGIHLSPIKRDLFETLVSLADKIGARAIAEGIEQPEEFDTVRRLGATLGQGYFFARPATPDAYSPIYFPP